MSVIIVNYNTLDITKNCLSSIKQFTSGITYEIILVDNASCDGSKEFFSSIDDITYIWSNDNIGFGKANNLGFNQSRGRYVLLLNSDTLILNNALKLFVDIADAEPDKNVGCWGCMLIDRNGHLTHSYGEFPTIWKDLFKETILIPYSKFTGNAECLRQGVTNPKSPVDYIIGADLLIKREVIEQLGLFDPRFFMYNEDVELQWRYHQHGIKRKIINGPMIKHLEGGSAKSQNKKTLSGSIMRLKSKMTYFYITTNSLSFFLYKVLLLLVRIPFFLFSKYDFNEKKDYLLVILYSKLFK